MTRKNVMPDIFVAPNDNSNELKMPSSTVVPSDLSSEHSHMFASFCQNPVQISFQTQESDEKILLFLRRHFVTNVPWIAIAIFLAIIPPISTLLNSQFSIFTLQIPNNFIAVTAVFYYLIIFSFAFTSLLTWFYNVFIVTKKRIVDIDYSDIVIHNVALTKISHVQDVSYTQSGFIRSLFNYGDVFVQTAGTERNFEALRVPKPRDAAHIIAELIGRKEHGP